MRVVQAQQSCDESSQAKRNFIESIAAYNLFVYFMQVKDLVADQIGSEFRSKPLAI